jgi:mannitol operon transcriptional antiterminator
MKQRHRTILRLLAGHTDYTTVEQLAEACGAGVRTVHRDLEQIERSLAFRGVRLERRRGYGVRLLDPLPAGLVQPGDDAVGTGEEHDATDRPLLMMLYLIANPGWCKISELAHVFFLSDSSVSTALGQLDPYLPAGLALDRQKGVGVRLSGDEVLLRVGFIGTFTRLFPLYFPDHHLDTQRFLRALRIGDAAHLLLRGIGAAEERLGYRISPSYAGMLYSYLFLLRRRLVEGHRIDREPKFFTGLPDVYLAVANLLEETALVDGVAGRLNEPERRLLGRVVAACEPMDSVRGVAASVTGELELPVEGVIERVLGRTEERDRLWLHDDSSLMAYLRLTLNAMTRRLDLFLRWNMAWLPAAHSLDSWSSDPIIDDLATEYRAAFPALFETWPVSNPVLDVVLRRELQEPYLAIVARLTALRRRRAAGLSVKILCYEGLGMSAWLGAVVAGILPSGATIDTSWDRDALATGSVDVPWDLIVATYPVAAGDTPCIVIDGDASPEEIRRRIEEVLPELLSRERSPGPSGVSTGGDSRSSGLSLPVIMSVVRSFFLESVSADDDLIECAVAALNQGDCNVPLLREDLVRRESYGSLVFEEIGVRLLHCRSNGIPEPRAGVLRPAQGGAILVLAAPRIAPPEHTGVLSEIVVALSDDPTFPELFATGDLEALQTGLIGLFSRRLQ